MAIAIRFCGKANRAFLPRSRCSRSAQPCRRHREPLQGAIAPWRGYAHRPLFYSVFSTDKGKLDSL